MPTQTNPNSLANLRPRWLPGQSGNPTGRGPNTESITWWYRHLLAENKGISAQAIAKMAIQKAKEGSLPHIQEVTDRTDGKVVDRMELTGQILVATPEQMELANQRQLQILASEERLLAEYSDATDGEFTEAPPGNANE